MGGGGRLKDGREITQRGTEAPSLGRQDSSVQLTECARPCRLARMGQSRVVSTDQGISAGISTSASAGRGLELEQRWGNIFLPQETAARRPGFEYIVCQHAVALVW